MRGWRVAPSANGARRFAVYVFERYQRDGATNIAASLAYTSLLSLVPLMAIALAMLAAFPVFADIRATLQDWVFTNFVPTVGEVVQDQVGRFIANAGRLSAAGIVGLAVSAIMVLVTIETSLNSIFRVSQPRTALSRVLIYWTLLTLGPLMIGAALSFQTYVAAMHLWSADASSTPWITFPLPTVLTAAAFTFMFAIVPNRRIATRDALAGGIVAALLFAVLRWGFALYISSSGSYTSVYGAVAVVPIFLFWMYLSWAVVLVGAEVTAALPEWRAGYAASAKRLPGPRRLTIALSILAELERSGRTGTGPVGRGQLLTATAVPEPELASVLVRLTSRGFIAPTTKRRYLLARMLDTVTLSDLVDALELSVTIDALAAAEAPWRAKAEACLAAAHDAGRDAMQVSLSELFGAAA